MSLMVILPSSTHESVNIAVRILEPGRLHATTFMNVTLEGEARHLVVLEGNALAPEGLDEFFHVLADQPGGCGCLVAPGVLGAVDQKLRCTCLVRDGLLLLSVGLPQAQGPLVKFLGRLQVPYGNCRHDLLTAQHCRPLHPRPRPTWPRSCRFPTRQRDFLRYRSAGQTSPCREQGSSP